MEIQSAPSSFFESFTGVAQRIRELESAHIVDQLIAERGHTLVRSPFFPLMRPLLYRILHYHEAVRMADAIAEMSAEDTFLHISRLLDLEVEAKGLENIPASGACIIASNHPTGIADGVAMFDLLWPRRPDHVYFANRDAIRVNPRLADRIIPVEWRASEKTHTKSRQTLVRTNRAFAEGNAIVMFPSGRIAYWDNDRLNERPWQPSIVQLARRYNVPVVPIHMSARNSGLFYYLSKRNPELRDMTVFHELLNKKRKRFEFTVGAPIPADALDGDPAAITERLQAHCEHALKADPKAMFDAGAAAARREAA